MGKKNHIKQVIGRFNRDTDSNVIAWPYSINDVTREMFVKIDLNNDKALGIVNIPYFLNETAIKELCLKSLSVPAARVSFNGSTSLHGDLKTGYRSGYLIFDSVQDKRRAFDACRLLIKPIELKDEVNLKLPWHRLFLGKKTLKRRHSEDMDPGDTEKIIEETKNEPNEEEWITVTKKSKLAFRGKINYVNTITVDNDKCNFMHNSMEISCQEETGCEFPKKKRKRR